jgi:hypothetical protein
LLLDALVLASPLVVSLYWIVFAMCESTTSIAD